MHSLAEDGRSGLEARSSGCYRGQLLVTEHGLQKHTASYFLQQSTKATNLKKTSLFSRKNEPRKQKTLEYTFVQSLSLSSCLLYCAPPCPPPAGNDVFQAPVTRPQKEH
eukprot:5046153-Amphidinium_carterae.1